MGEAALKERSARRRTYLVRRLTQALDLPMAVLSLVFFGLLVADVASLPDAEHHRWLDQASLAIWALFVLEFALRLAIAPDRRRFLRRSWFDVLVLAVPMLRVLRALRALRFLRAAKALRAVSMFRLGGAVRRNARVLSGYARATIERTGPHQRAPRRPAPRSPGGAAGQMTTLERTKAAPHVHFRRRHGRMEDWTFRSSLYGRETRAVGFPSGVRCGALLLKSASSRCGTL